MSLPLRVIHVYQTLLERGGVESLLEIHRREDAGVGLAAEFRLLFDRRPPPPDARYGNFNFRWFHSLARMRREFGRVMAGSVSSVVVHHNLWGMPFLAPADASGRRLAFLHSNQSFYREFLLPQRGWLDGVICCSPLEVGNIRRLLPELDAERVVALPLAAPFPETMPSRPAVNDRTVILGYAGRLWRGQKRLDRLPDFLERLDRCGVNYRFELLGDGPYEAALRRRLGGRENVRFLGWLRGPEYWRTLASWDAVVYFSDVEGGPLALLEAMAAGAIPFFPAIGGSLGDYYAPRVDPRCLYPAADMAGAARAVCDVFAPGRNTLTALHEKSAELVRGHTVAAYERAFADFVERIARLPRISRPPESEPKLRWEHRLPLGFVTRFRLGALRRP